MEKRDENSKDSSNLDFTLKAMQQQFKRLNVVLRDMRHKMDRQVEKLANLQNDLFDDGTSSRQNRRNHEGNETLPHGTLLMKRILSIHSLPLIMLSFESF